MTPEGSVKELIKKLLKKYGAYYHMPVTNGMGAPTLDFICCYRGYFIAIEAKAPGKRPTPRQVITMQKIEAAGGFAFAVSCRADLDIVEAYLQLLGP